MRVAAVGLGLRAPAVGPHQHRLYGYITSPKPLAPRGYTSRLQWLAARGLPLPNAALEAAGWAGDLAAVEFCLRLPLQAPAASSALAVEEAGQALQEILASAALAAGQVPVLRLLRGRGGAVICGFLVKSAVFECVYEDAGCSGFPCLPALRYLAMEGGPDMEVEGEPVDWSEVFTSAASHGADLALLRILHEQRGAVVDLEAVAGAGSEEQLEWALAQPRPAPGPEHVAADQADLLLAALVAGNWSTAHWLLRRHAADTPQQQQQQQQLLQQAFCDVAERLGGAIAMSAVVPTLWHLYRWCDMQWSRKCRRALRQWAARAGHLGRLRVVSGQARQMREMLRDADAALAVGRCGGGARRESVVSEEEGSEQSEDSEE